MQRSVVLDTHALHWWSAEPERVSRGAEAAIVASDEVLMAAISWFELAWLARADRIEIRSPLRAWLDTLAREVRTIPLTPAIAERAVTLPDRFPPDPADRLIYASATEAGAGLVTKDRRLREQPDSIAIW